MYSSVLLHRTRRGADFLEAMFHSIVVITGLNSLLDNQESSLSPSKFKFWVVFPPSWPFLCGDMHMRSL